MRRDLRRSERPPRGQGHVRTYVHMSVRCATPTTAFTSLTSTSLKMRAERVSERVAQKAEYEYSGFEIPAKAAVMEYRYGTNVSRCV